MSTTSRSLLVAVLAAAIVPATASAATQRYASPNGAGVACTAGAPCAITTAVTGAANGDEVVVTPGDYLLTSILQNKTKIDIHGVAGQPRPRLLFSGPNQLGVRFENGGTLRYVEISQTANAVGLFITDSVADGIIVQSASSSYTGNIQNSQVRNSVFVAYAPGARAVLTDTNGGLNTSTLRNVTAIANGAAAAIEANAAGGAGGKATINLVNVIARSNGVSLLAATNNSGSYATINVSYSNYGSVGTAGTNADIPLNFPGNQSYLPKFVDPSVVNYREAAGSPTIDKGLDDPLNGAFDLDGGARIVGTTDIGAGEFVPPAPPPAGGGGGGGGGSSSSDPAPVADPVPDIGPAPQMTVDPIATAAIGFPGVRLVSTRLRLVGRYVTVRLRCPVETVDSCTGRTKVVARNRKRGSHKAGTLVLGRARFAIAAGRSATVKVHVSRTTRHRLAHVRRLRALVTNAARSGAGQSATSSASVTIRRAT